MYRMYLKSTHEDPNEKKRKSNIRVFQWREFEHVGPIIFKSALVTVVGKPKDIRI